MKELSKYCIWILSATIWSTICFILPDFSDNPAEGWRGILTQIVYISACGIGNLFFLYLVGCNKYVCTILLPIYGAVGAAVAFYRVIYHVTITPMIIEVVLHTNTEEALGVLSWQIVVWILFNVCIATGLVCVRFRYIHLSRIWIHALAVLIIGSGYLFCNNRLHASLLQRYPYNVFYNIEEYHSLKQTIAEERIIPRYRVDNIPDSLTIILVIGEAARADHLSLNGYARETTPHLSKRKNVVSLPNIYSEQTHTLASVPYILTRTDSIHEAYQYTETSFVPIFRQEDFRTIWISNQDLGASFAHFLAECDTSIFANAGKSTYVFSQWLDEEMLPIIDKYDGNKCARNLYIIHTIGSHWYYNNHVTQKHYVFQPITTNRLITNNTLEQITNSYDNTIFYMDEFLDSLIMRFEDSPTLIIYQADHGEALGESNQFLHANDVEAVKCPACILWYSDKYAEIYPDKIKALIRNKDKRYRTDYVFYSILSAADIEAEGDTPSMNIFR